MCDNLFHEIQQIIHVGEERRAVIREKCCYKTKWKRKKPWKFRDAIESERKRATLRLFENVRVNNLLCRENNLDVVESSVII